jgi:hypothetical protein
MRLGSSPIQRSGKIQKMGDQQAPTSLSNVLVPLFNHSSLDLEFLASMAPVSIECLRFAEAAWKLRQKMVEARLIVPGAVVYRNIIRGEEVGKVGTCEVCRDGIGISWPCEGASLVCNACTRTGPLSVRLVDDSYCIRRLAMS